MAAVVYVELSIVAESFTEFQMYIVFEFEDSGHDLESVEVRSDSWWLDTIHCCYYGW